MSEEKKSFTVKDRRHFAADGSSRDEADDPDTAAPAVSPAASTPQESTPSDPAPPDAHDEPGVDFAGFLLSLAAQASMTLGGEEGDKPDLVAARHFISLLEMLQDKTEGRRTPEEDQILKGILYQLRVAFVARARPGGA